MDFILENWAWMTNNPIRCITIAFTSALIGFRFAKFYYERQIGTLEANANYGKFKGSEFRYSESGRHGKNILSPNTHTVSQNEKVSLRAEIPSGSNLQIHISGSLNAKIPAHAMGAWYYTPATSINWTANVYKPDSNGSQRFFAEDGRADLEMHFEIIGEILIEAYEGNSQSPNWSRKIAVIGP